MAEGFLDKWSAGVNTAADSVNSGVNSALNKASEWAAKGKSSKQSGELWGSNYNPADLKIRDKLVVEMPDWLLACPPVSMILSPLLSSRISIACRLAW